MADVRNQAQSEQIADLEARLAMVTLPLRRALMHYIPYTKTIFKLQPGGGEISQTVPNPTRVEAEKALEATDADVQAFLARVKRQGAAEALGALHARLLSDGMPYKPKYPYELTHILDEAIRAAELEREA